MILSVSRRTDIPSYYSEWFFNRLSEGYALVRNPMNYHSVSKINLTPDIVDCIVFWTKNPEPMIKYLPKLEDKYMYYFQYTLNGYENEVEPNIPSLEKRIETFRIISDKLGKKRVIWRYDPVLLTDKYTIEWHIDKFSYIAEKLSGYTDNCVFSFVDIYDKIKTNMRDLNYVAINEKSCDLIAKNFVNIAKKNAICLKSCTESKNLSKFDIQPSCCIDPVLISELLDCNIKTRKDKNQRESCGCVESVDLGQYNTCKNGCRYCYANYSRESVNKNFCKHNPNSPLLIGNLENDDKVVERKLISIKDAQLSLF